MRGHSLLASLFLSMHKTRTLLGHSSLSSPTLSIFIRHRSSYGKRTKDGNSMSSFLQTVHDKMRADKSGGVEAEEVKSASTKVRYGGKRTREVNAKAVNPTPARVINSKLEPKKVDVLKSQVTASSSLSRADASTDLVKKPRKAARSPTLNPNLTVDQPRKKPIVTKEVDPIQLAWLRFESQCKKSDHGMTTTSITSFLTVLLSNKKLDLMVKALTRAKKLGIQPDIRWYELLLEACCQVESPRQALKVFKRMEADGISPSMECHATYMELLCSQGDFEQAKAYFASTYQPVPVKANEVANMTEGQSTSESLPPTIVNPPPDTLVYLRAMMGCARRKRAHEAQYWMDKLLSEPLVTPTSACFEALGQAYIEAGDLTGAEKVWDDMLNRSLIPPEQAIIATMNAYMKKGQAHKAVAFCERPIYLSLYDTVDVLAVRAVAYAQSGEVSRVFEIMQKLSALKCTIPSRNLERIVEGLSRNGFTTDAARLCSQGTPLSTYLILMEGFNREECPDEAAAILQTIRDSGMPLTTSMFATVIKGFAAANNVEAVERYFDQARDAGLVDAQLWKLALTSYVQVSDIDRALELVEAMTEQEGKEDVIPDIDPIFQLFESCIRARRWADAATSFGILSGIRGVESNPERVTRLLDMHANEFHHIACQLLRGDLEAESDGLLLSGPPLGLVLYKALTTATKPLPERLYRTAMNFYSQDQDLVAVVSTWTTMRNHITAPSATTVTTLLQAVVAQGGERTAKATLDMMTKEKLPLDIDGYRALLTLMGRSGKPKDAIALLVDMDSKGTQFGSVEWEILRDAFRRGHWKKEERYVVRFLEEHYPEVLDIADGDAVDSNNSSNDEEDGSGDESVVTSSVKPVSKGARPSPKVRVTHVV
ncbi:hypothetical protein SmJEL517_g00972 [Synchytrium microbalum]|uniref:Pentacotripeptide-repeat region of PRORP domain-containing protein n=1 Tax=Synchytrium microbalum TaxID=1806994 RepID=A0A507CBS4_9FUNG|nr:uncharacterized protein SmJEL517_g00972 [Synchytrium microbalum]TPX36941.1 hypothetical protein SmJEL517_g00972 [Synchytrium microbalum]